MTRSGIKRASQRDSKSKGLHGQRVQKFYNNVPQCKGTWGNYHLRYPKLQHNDHDISDLWRHCIKNKPDSVVEITTWAPDHFCETGNPLSVKKLK